MNKYEAVFILDIKKIEDDGTAYTKELSELIVELGGKVVESVNMGRKTFAREIKRQKAGQYWNYIFEVAPDKVEEIRNKYRLDPRVIRMFTIIYDRPEEK